MKSIIPDAAWAAKLRHPTKLSDGQVTVLIGVNPRQENIECRRTRNRMNDSDFVSSIALFLCDAKAEGLPDGLSEFLQCAELDVLGMIFDTRNGRLFCVHPAC